MDLPSLLSDLIPPLLIQLAKFGGDLYLEHRHSRSRPPDEEPRGKHEKRS
jgi:hypothetical protein